MYVAMRKLLSRGMRLRELLNRTQYCSHADRLSISSTHDISRLGIGIVNYTGDCILVVVAMQAG